MFENGREVRYFGNGQDYEETLQELAFMIKQTGIREKKYQKAVSK